MSRRTEQVSAVLQRAIQDVISRGLHDPRISGMITVTGVDVPVDMSRATVHFTVIPVERESLTRYGLQDAAGFIRRRVGDVVRMRRVPDLTFMIDMNAKEQASVLLAIAKARAEFTENQLDGGAELGGGSESEDEAVGLSDGSVDGGIDGGGKSSADDGLDCGLDGGLDGELNSGAEDLA